MTQKLLHLRYHSEKIRNPIPKKFRRLADPSVWALEQLFSAIGRGAMALVRQLKAAGFRLKSRYDIFVEWPSSVKWNETKFFSFIPLKQAIDFAQDTLEF